MCILRVINMILVCRKFGFRVYMLDESRLGDNGKGILSYLLLNFKANIKF